MKPCPHCTFEIEDNATTCKYCGRKVEADALNQTEATPTPLTATPAQTPAHQTAPADDFSVPPLFTPETVKPKKNNRPLIIVAIIMLLLCVCCAAVAAYTYTQRDQLGISQISQMLASATATPHKPSATPKVPTVTPAAAKATYTQAAGSKATATSKPAGATATPSAANSKPGQPVQAGNYQISVNSLTKSDGTQSIKPDIGKTYLLINLTVKNTLDKSAVFSSFLQASLTDSSGTVYPVDAMGIAAAGAVPVDSEIKAGESKTGVMAFAIPKSASGFTLLIQPDFLKKDKIQIPLGQ